MNCPWVPRIVECARTGQHPTAEIRPHLAECNQCAERWAREELLSSHLRSIRQASAVRQVPVEGRRLVLERFAASRSPRIAHSKIWLALAASLVIGFVSLTSRQHRQAPGGVVETETDWSAEGFVAVPFALPLASGEFVKVIHADLQPSDFARMGIDLDTVSASPISADVMVGEDDLPRAVRVSGEGSSF